MYSDKKASHQFAVEVEVEILTRKKRHFGEIFPRLRFIWLELRPPEAVRKDISVIFTKSYTFCSDFLKGWITDMK